MDDKHRGRPGLRIFLVVENMAVISTKCRLHCCCGSQTISSCATYLDIWKYYYFQTKPMGILHNGVRIFLKDYSSFLYSLLFLKYSISFFKVKIFGDRVKPRGRSCNVVFLKQEWIILILKYFSILNRKLTIVSLFTKT